MNEAEPVNLLTDEECEIIQKLSETPELNLKNAGHSYRYYGVDREPYLTEINQIENILIKWCPSLHRFCNFTGTTPNRIRVLTHYGSTSGFIGVHYLPLPSDHHD